MHFDGRNFGERPYCLLDFLQHVLKRSMGLRKISRDYG